MVTRNAFFSDRSRRIVFDFISQHAFWLNPIQHCPDLLRGEAAKSFEKQELTQQWCVATVRSVRARQEMLAQS